MGVVKTDRHDDIPVVLIANPPVNALGYALRSALYETFRQLDTDSSVRAIVLGSAEKVFCAGADITEFGQAPLEPSLFQLFAVVDALSKPIVAAVSGAALGGGFELPLSCDARIATSQAVFGLPEVKLGLLPGAGGTQRLPRLTNAVVALEMICDGEPRKADSALDTGIIDEIAAKDILIESAVNLARKLAKHGRRRISSRAMNIAELADFDAKAAEKLRKQPDVPEIQAIVTCIRKTFELDFVAGYDAEQLLFRELRDGLRSKALRYAFFSERQSAKVGAVPAKPALPVHKVAIIGGGIMGSGIAMSFANAGIPTTIIETDAAAADRDIARINAVYDASVRRGSLSAEVKAQRLSHIAIKIGLEHVAEADLVVEAAFEDMNIKREIFSKISEAAKAGAVLATNTSYLDVNEIAAFTNRRTDVLGMHFFSPANVMRLVEIVRTKETSPEALARCIDVAKRLGKIPVVVGVCHGFVRNRMLARRSEQVDRLLLEGATPQQVDRVLTDFGFRMGPCAMSDLAGLDISWQMRKATGRKAPIADALCAQRRFGQKTAKGYYLYPEGARLGVNDPEVSRLMEEVSARKNIQRRDIDDREVLERLLYPMINEAARILDEGIAVRASDIDVIWLHGYGWPRGTGGPMFYAQQIGGLEIAQKLKFYAKQYDDVSLAPFDNLSEWLCPKDLKW